MKKCLLLLILVLLCVLMGCSSSASDADDFESKESYNDGYDNGYKEGYEEGYDIGYEQSFYDNVICSEELHDFTMMIVNLMYDYEYEVVEKLLEYYPEGVETALEFEFGVKDITVVIEYLDELSQTVVGQCEFCAEPVYADEIGFLPDGVECAHSECVSREASGELASIKKR